LLTRDDLRLMLTAFRISRKTLIIIKENLFWAFVFNAVTIPLAAGLFTVFGLPGMRPEVGAAAMAVSSLLVVGNSLRLRKA
ncbi:cation-transporting ATPase PacS, partial [bacterium]|nr:cation-transporting ATPase PacS [bacterium]